MSLLKFGLRPGLIASAVVAAILVFAVPGAYDALGEGPSLVKSTARQSAKGREVCGDISRFLIIPWRLSIEDSDSRGDLELSYWVSCKSKGGTSRVEAALSHSGGGWQIKSIELVADGVRHNLLAVPAS